MSLTFVYTAVSWVLLRWHSLFNLFLDDNSGLNWALSIVFLVITARLLLFRTFIKQVTYQRHMQQMQPKIQALRQKYKNDRTEMQRQMTKLQQEEGFNPLAGCLPILIQIPIFIGLFHVLRHLAAAASTAYQVAHPGRLTLYGFSRGETLGAAKARLFGAPLAGRLTDTAHQLGVLGGAAGATRLVIVIVVVLSAAATLLTQVLARRGQPSAPEGTAATVQRMLLVMIPVSTSASGLFFPLGVLLYWLTSNVWTTGQQLFINRFHPAPPPGTDPPPRPTSPRGPNGPNGPNGSTSRQRRPSSAGNRRPRGTPTSTARSKGK
jgi:YidC/Oxa1 family membrane protein insertase